MHLSVIIPHYNLPEWLLRRCLDTLFAQPMEGYPFEVIVVDDGSLQSPAPIINSYRRNNLRLIIQPHKRLGAARNTGLQHAQGKYILFVDADDYLFPDTLPRLLSMAEEQSCDILNFAYLSCQTKEAEPPTQPSPIHCDAPCSGDAFMQRHPLYGTVWHYLFKRSLCESAHLRFAEQVFIEDEVFTTLLHHHAQAVSTTNLTLYAYYQRPGSITTDRRPERQRELIDCHFSAIHQLQSYYKEVSSHQPTSGLCQKISLLTLDIIRRLLREKEWRPLWEAYRPRLEQLGVYPLSNPHYGWKHTLFCLLANQSWGLPILHKLEKQLNRPSR